MTGQSVEEVQEWQYASDMLGVSYDRVKDSLKEITNKMQEAQNGSEDTAKAFETLGVKLEDTDGNLRSADAVFYDVIDSLGNMHNQAQRDALAMDLMSESAQELNPLIEVGSEGLKKYTDEAHEMGYVLDNEAVEALAATDAAQQKLLKTQEAVTKQISAEYAPYMTEALGDTADFCGVWRCGQIWQHPELCHADLGAAGRPDRRCASGARRGIEAGRDNDGSDRGHDKSACRPVDAQRRQDQDCAGP